MCFALLFFSKCRKEKTNIYSLGWPQKWQLTKKSHVSEMRKKPILRQRCWWAGLMNGPSTHFSIFVNIFPSLSGWYEIETEVMWWLWWWREIEENQAYYFCFQFFSPLTCMHTFVLSTWPPHQKFRDLSTQGAWRKFQSWLLLKKIKGLNKKCTL